MQNTTNNTNLKDAKSINQLRTQGIWETEHSLDGSTFIKCGERFTAFIETDEDTPSKEEDEANAQYICLAVNNLQKCLDALDSAYTLLLNEYGYNGIILDDIDEIKEAINKATI